MFSIIPSGFIHLVLTGKLNRCSVVFAKFKLIAELVNVFPRDGTFAGTLFATSNHHNGHANNQ